MTNDNSDNRSEHSSKEATCCSGSECGCDEECFEQLARAICANDDGHIHHDTPAVDSEKAADTISVISEATCNCEEAGDKEQLQASATTEGIDNELNAAQRADVHFCALRKRKTQTKAKAALPSVACGEHRSLAKNRYSDTLAAFGCICKAMLARGMQSCCSARSSGSNSLAASLLGHRGATKSRVSVDSCASSCCKNASIKSRSRISLDSCCKDGCCEDDHASRTTSHAKPRSCAGVASCCTGAKACGRSVGAVPVNRRVSVDSCARSCCAESIKDEDLDPEKQDRAIKEAPSDGLNHAVLAVKGMTCTGCENKLIRALRAQAAITNIKTSLVLSRAEFDYSGSVADLQALVASIEKRTGFATTPIEATSAACALELTVAPASLGKFLLASYPDGVQQVSKVDKHTVRVIHNPHIIGAREVLAAYDTFSPVLAPQPPDPSLAAGAKHIKLMFWRTLISALLTIPVLIMTWAPLPEHHRAYAIVSLVLATLVQVSIAGPFYGSALKSLIFSGLVETDLLIVLSTTTAYTYSVVAFAFDMKGQPLQGGSFFETSTLLVTLIMCGQLASAIARQRAVAAISLRSLQQQTATLVLTQWDGRLEEQTVDVRLLQYDDTFRVHPDSVIITDGVIISGSTTVDESMITGEALPVEKSVSSEVLAGTTNGPGSLLVRVTRLPGENTISEIANMVDDARFSRARIQSIVDRVCAWFVPVILVLAIVTFVAWILVGVYVREQGAGDAAVKALTYAIAVLAISCPCAIGLAVPMVVLVASGVAARLGLVFKAATTIESAKNIKHIVFDKTGTLTLGRLEVVQAEFEGGDEIAHKSVILALAAMSKHPVARAVAEYLTAAATEASTQVNDIKEVTGCGVEGTLTGEPLRGGNAKWLGLENHPLVSASLASGSTTFCVVHGNTLLGFFALSDTIRPEVLSVLSSLSARGIKVSILSGDHAAAVNRVAAALNIPSDRVAAGCLPADKAAYIRDLQAKGEKVLFCGDGTNDSVALAQADIGVHMSSDAAVAGAGAAASSASDAVLMRPSLTGLISLVELSEAVHRRIVMNFAWSGVYNLVAVLFAAGAFVNVRITPAYAGLGEIVSVLPVVLVALQLKWFKGTA